MNTILDYTVENIKMIFNLLRSTDENRSCYWFSVKLDQVEIVSMSNELNRFNDFMLYDLSNSEEMEFKFYFSPERIAHTYKFFLQGERQWESHLLTEKERLENENGELKSEIKILTEKIRKQDRQKFFEKPEGIKAIDAGEFIVIFMPKKEIDNMLGEQLKQMYDGVSALEKAERIFHRFIYQPKK